MYLQGSFNSIFINNNKQFLAKETRLTREIHELIVQADSNKNDTTERQNKLEEKQKELEELMHERSNVIYYKNKANCVEYGEKCTKFFMNLQYSNANKNNLQKLVTEDGVIYDSPNYILKEEASYFYYF